MTGLEDEDYESLDLDDRRSSRSDSAPTVIDDFEDDDADDDLDEDDDDLEDDDEDDEDDDDEDDEDDDEDDEDEDDEDDEEDPEDAEADEIDFVLAVYREDGAPVVSALADDLANDLEELITQLRRMPGDAGALGFVSLVGEVFVIVRVRGAHVQVLLSDGSAAADWPIARDVADLLDAEIPDDEESDPMGDLDLLADLGLSDFDLSRIVDDPEATSDQMVVDIAEKIKVGPQFRTLAEAAVAP